MSVKFLQFSKSTTFFITLLICHISDSFWVSLIPAYINIYCCSMQEPRYLCLQSLHDLSHIIASPLSNTPAQVFSSLLFQLSNLFLIQAENTRNNQSSFPIALTTLSYLFIDFRNFCISNSSSKSSLQYLYRNFFNFHHRFSPKCSFLKSCSFFLLLMTVYSHSHKKKKVLKHFTF